MADRFVVKSNVDLIAGGFHAADLDDAHFSVFDSLKNEVVGTDGGEPEDQLLVRDWRWVAEALNVVDRERASAAEAARARAEAADAATAAKVEIERLRGVIREAVAKLTNLHCKTKRDQSRLCMAFDALYAEQG